MRIQGTRKGIGTTVVAVAAALLALGGALAAPPKSAPAKTAPAVDYDRDVRPILSENCFACHGFDANKRQAGLRLDTAAGATLKLPSGDAALVPGKPQASGLLTRVLQKVDEPTHMPPAASGKKLKPAQIETLRRWIAEGGKYAPHWAFVAPKRPVVPVVKNAAWAKNPIDRFILAKLESEGLTPSPEADKRTLIRRVSFDLTGLPPTWAEVSAFVADTRPGAYERLVDRLLASPRYGERMALAWLDVARYADTHGYHIDSQRDMWRWRDWVIASFNRNQPYDQFVVEQLAGDLLPNATRDQKIATGFNRNHPINFEGGAIPEEYAAQYVHDRVNTTSTAFMGLTVACAQCHDHKYDPITQKDYYRLFAFFNNVPENGLDGQRGNAAPFLKAPLPEQEQQMALLTREVAARDAALKAHAAEAAPAQTAWEASANPLAAWETKTEAGRIASENAVDFERTDAFSYGAWVNPATKDGMTVFSHMDPLPTLRGWDLYLSGGKVFVHLIHAWDKNVIRLNTKAEIPVGKKTHLFVSYDGSSKAKGVTIYVNGKPAEVEITHDTLTESIRSATMPEPSPIRIGKRSEADAPFQGQVESIRLYDRALPAAEVNAVFAVEGLRPILAVAPAARTDEQKAAVAEFYLNSVDATYPKLAADLAEWKKKQADLDAAIPTTMVMEEMPKPRETHLLLRGQYDQKGPVVTPATPAALPALTLAADAKPDRLALARWLVSPAHPLTSRVAVNRYWQMLFGQGLVRTAENFGTQGEFPTHPELLDWLATEFTRTGWDVKAMLRRIVTSATYRQRSTATPALLARDPENRLLARAPRIRLAAEMVRDAALVESGLLVEKIGGPSVKPYQPEGLWEELSFKGDFSAQYYVQDHGDALYRRSMYTFWKRTVPPPSLQTFDAPEREFCLVRRSVTNTPLQALVLMNDPTFTEAARKLAERMMTESPNSPPSRVFFAFNQVVGRPPSDDEVKVLLRAFNEQWQVFSQNKPAALKLLSVGESKRNEKLDAAELAAWTTVASILFNLDESITKG